MELPRKNIEAPTAAAYDDDLIQARTTYRPAVPAPKIKTSSPRVIEARAKFVGSLVYSLALLALGGVVTGIAYALASPGGTYVVTSGLFLIAGIYFCVAIWNLLKWLALKAARK